MVTFGEPLGRVITLCGQNLVSCRVLCVLVCCVCCGVCALSWCCVGVVCPFKTPVCRFKTCPCVRLKRFRVCRQNARMLKHMCAWCRYTRGRFERTHGHVLNRHTGVLNGHTTPTQHHDNAHTPQHIQHNTTTRQQHHTEIERDRDRDRDRERRQDRERREDGRGETKQDKTG